MARPQGSKVVACPDCGKRIVAMQGETGKCKHCGKKVRFTIKLLKSLGKLK